MGIIPSLVTGFFATFFFFASFAFCFFFKLCQHRIQLHKYYSENINLESKCLFIKGGQFDYLEVCADSCYWCDYFALKVLVALIVINFSTR